MHFLTHLVKVQVISVRTDQALDFLKKEIFQKE